MLASLMQQYKHVTPMCIECIQTEELESRAKSLEQQGCDLILARGLQANLAKSCVALPVIDIRVTVQDLGMTVLELRKSLAVERPKIGLIGFANTLCDTEQFDELFSVELIRYTTKQVEQLKEFTNRAVTDGCQAVIGGQVVCNRAYELGIPSHFLPFGEESLRNALDIAERVCYAIDLEKSNSAEMNAMLDITFSGIMQINQYGMICRANQMVLNLLERRSEELIGKPVRNVLPQLSQQQLDNVLLRGEELYASLLAVGDRAVIVNIAPIITEQIVKGAILTFQESSRIIEMESELRREMLHRGFVASCSFNDFIKNSNESVKLVDLSKRISRFPAPVLLTGEPGAGKMILAQCIHNESLRARNAFVGLDCSAYQEDTLDTMLFGNYSARKDGNTCLADMARGGTIYLSNIEALSMELQYKILELIQGKIIHNGSNWPISIEIRVIASSTKDLLFYVEQGLFRSDLYYALSVLKLKVPPLRERREDIVGWFRYYMVLWQKEYKRYIYLTQGAQAFLKAYDWPGNLTQMNNICHRTALLAERRIVDEVFLMKQLEQVVPRIVSDDEQPGTVFQDKRAKQILDLLHKHQGNRQMVADELGISKTTLWRRMKKFGISKDDVSDK